MEKIPEREEVELIEGEDVRDYQEPKYKINLQTWSPTVVLLVFSTTQTVIFSSLFFVP